jgi:hypothetical protein
MATPASAATTPARPPLVQGAYQHHNWGGWDDDDWDFRGLYGSRWACERAGRYQTHGGWRHDDYVCVRSDQWRPRWNNNRYGNWHDQWNHGNFRRGGAWVLYVED